MHARSTMLLAVACALAAACERRQPLEAGGAAALARNLARAPAIEVHVQEAALSEPLERLAARERRRTGADVRVVEGWGGESKNARIVVATRANPRAVELLERAGVALAAEGFVVGSLLHARPADRVRVCLADPERAGLPVTLWFGNDAALLALELEDLAPLATPRVEAFRAARPSVSGPIGIDGGFVEADLERTGFARQALRGRARTFPAQDGIVIDAPLATGARVVEHVRTTCARARRRALEWTGGAQAADVFVRVTENPAELALAGEASALARASLAECVADVLVVEGLHDRGAAAARASLRSALGPAVDPWIEEGASVDAAGAWWGIELDVWLARLALAGRVLSAAQCLDPRSDGTVSPHVLLPSRAALFAHLRAERGDAFVRSLWGGTRALQCDAALEAAFEAAWRARAQPHLSAERERARTRRDDALAGGPRAGAVLAARGAGAATRASAALAPWSQLGAQSVALPLTFLDDPDPDAPPRPARPIATLEGDAGLYALAVRARRAGIEVAFLVAVLASDGGSYAAGWATHGEEQYAALYGAHARRVEHAGFLAELAGATWLSVGEGMRSVSNAPPNEAARAARADGWRRVVGAARGAFAGLLTYGACDPAEAEAVSFWKDVDALGCELHSGPTGPWAPPPDDRELVRQITELARAAHAVAKPLVLTRASLPSVRGPAPGPEDRGAGEHLAHLAGALEALDVPVRGVWLCAPDADAARLLAGEDPRAPAFRSWLGSAGAWSRAASRATAPAPR